MDKTIAKLQLVIDILNKGKIKISQRNVPYISLDDCNIAWFWRTRKYRLFPLKGDKRDFYSPKEIYKYFMSTQIKDIEYPF